MAVFHIASLLDSHDGLDKCILKNVIGQFLVSHRVIYIHENTVFVSLQQRIKGLILAIDIQRNELLIALVIIVIHY